MQPASSSSRRSRKRPADDITPEDSFETALLYLRDLRSAYGAMLEDDGTSGPAAAPSPPSPTSLETASEHMARRLAQLYQTALLLGESRQ
jgi:hypothetical protein